MKEKNQDSQQVQCVLLFLPDWHPFCLSLVIPVPSHLPGSGGGASHRRRHPTQTDQNRLNPQPFTRVNGKATFWSVGLDSERIYVWSSWEPPAEGIPESKANTKGNKTKRWKDRFPMVSLD